MGMFNILDISAAGLDVQQARLQAAASNLAHANTSSAAGGAVYKPLSVAIHSSQSTADLDVRFEGLPRPFVASVSQAEVAPRLVYDPGHPDADERGFVAYPGVDPLTLMLDLMSISRNYEANLRAFDITRSLLQRTMDIGSRR